MPGKNVRSVFRRSIYLSLTIFLVLVLAYVIAQSSREPEPPAPPPAELIRRSKPSPTRVLRPVDLEVVQSSIDVLETGTPNPQAPDGATGSRVRHTIVILNKGEVGYQAITLELAYENKNGKTLSVITRQVEESLGPGKSLSISDLEIESLPPGIVDCKASVRYADIEQVPGTQ